MTTGRETQSLNILVASRISRDRLFQLHHFLHFADNSAPFILQVICCMVRSTSKQSVCPRMHKWRIIWSLDADNHRRTTSKELQAYMGFMVLMGIVHMLSIYNYWKKIQSLIILL